MDLEKQHHKVEKGENPFEICHNYIVDPANTYTFGAKWGETFKMTLGVMDQCIVKLEKEEPLGAFSFTPIEECLNFLNSITVEKQPDEELLEFIRAYIFLAFNLNNNLNKHESVVRKISYLQRYCDKSLTFNETLSLMSTCALRVSRWRDWLPPSFRLSGHYYNLLKED